MLVLTEIPECPARAAETFGLLDIQIFTAVQRDPAQTESAPQHGFPGINGGEAPNSPTQMRLGKSHWSKPNSKSHS